MSQAEKPQEQLFLLGIFRRVQFPIDPACLLQLSNSESEELQRAALVALENVSHPSALDIAFRMMREELNNRDLAIFARITSRVIMKSPFDGFRKRRIAIAGTGLEEA